MNTIIYKISKNLKNLLEKLEDVKEISISFAMDEKNLIDLIGQLKPEVIFLNENEIPSLLDTIILESTKLKLYTIDDSLSSLKLQDYKNDDLVQLKNNELMLFFDE